VAVNNAGGVKNEKDEKVMVAAPQATHVPAGPTTNSLLILQQQQPSQQQQKKTGGAAPLGAAMIKL
jgi:hypothetical protein